MAYTFRWVPTPGQNNNFVNGSVNGGKASAIRDDGQIDPFDSPLYICIPPTLFEGGNAGAATLLDFARTIATCGVFSRVQQPGLNYRGYQIGGGSLTLNGNPCGNYEFNLLEGGTTLNQASVATLFSSNNDLSSWIVCKGDLTIGSSTTLIPTVNPSYVRPSKGFFSYPPDPDAKRRLFMVVYATGNLTFTDSTSYISMAACGANTSSTGANIASFNVPIASNIYYFSSGGINPTIQSTGATGAAGVSNSSGGSGGNAAISANGSQLQTGGGGSGSQTGGGANSGAGGNGSPFSGGTGGGSSGTRSGATAGSSLGGAGGDGASTGGSFPGGTGNPGGSGGVSGNAGTGGVVIIICEGAITIGSGGGGWIDTSGVSPASDSGSSGGGSGGGILTVIQSSSTANIPNIINNGGQGGSGGQGGTGSIYKYGINS